MSALRSTFVGIEGTIIHHPRSRCDLPSAGGFSHLGRHRRDLHGRRRRGRGRRAAPGQGADRPPASVPEHRGGPVRPRPELGLTVTELLARTDVFTYGTTRATNAIVEGKTARTAFFTTEGFPDVLLLREGGKLEPFRQLEFGAPYVPRHLTFEIRERIDSEGDVFVPLDDGG